MVLIRQRLNYKKKRVDKVMNLFYHASFDELWEPKIMIFSIFVWSLYMILLHGPIARRISGQQHLATTSQTVSFTWGMILLYCSFSGPLDYLSDNYLFSAHMIQHMIEITIMTPLVMRGLPDGVYQYLFTSRWTKHIVRAWANPIAAGGIFNIVLTIFHSPTLYNYALISEPFHFFEHGVFFIISFFMWMPLLKGISLSKLLTPGQKMLYLLYNYNLMMPIVVLLLISNHPWYEFYVHAPRIIPGLSALGDMQLGAIIMILFMAGAYVSVAIKQYIHQDELVWYR